MWKMREKHCRTWNMGRNTQKRGKFVMYNVGSGIWQKNKKQKTNKQQKKNLNNVQYERKTL